MGTECAAAMMVGPEMEQGPLVGVVVVAAEVVLTLLHVPVHFVNSMLRRSLCKISSLLVGVGESLQSSVQRISIVQAPRRFLLFTSSSQEISDNRIPDQTIGEQS